MNNRKKKLLKRIIALSLTLICTLMAVERFMMKRILDSYYPDNDHSIMLYVSIIYVILGLYFLAVAIKARFLLGVGKRG